MSPEVTKYPRIGYLNFLSLVFLTFKEMLLLEIKKKKHNKKEVNS